MASCVDNERLGRIGCGTKFSGNQQHSVAKVEWSEHPDGMAHVTFASIEAPEMCWKGDAMRHPASLTHAKTKAPLLEMSDRGWRRARPATAGVGQAPNSDANVPVAP